MPKNRDSWNSIGLKEFTYDLSCAMIILKK